MTSSKELPKLLYVQRVHVHLRMAETYSQFLLKLKSAFEEQDIDREWSIYEDPFATVRDTRIFVFIRPMDAWADLDRISLEKSLSEIMVTSHGEQQGLQWMQVVQKATKKMETQVLSQVPHLNEI